MATNVLIVDDTVVYRKILSEAVDPLVDGGSVVTAPNGSVALKKLASHPFDLVLLDVQMPEMDGIETLTCIRDQFPRVVVVMVSAATAKGSETAIKALNLGALDLIQKPQGSNPSDNLRQLRTELSAVMKVMDTRRLTGSAGRSIQSSSAGRSASAVAAPPPAPVVRRVPGRPAVTPATFSLLAVGSSTGGPEALSKFIPNLPADFPLPIVLVQHMPPVFTEALAKDLDRKSPLAVKEVADGDRVVPGRVLIARGGAHMVVRNTPDGLVARLDNGPPENSCRPAVDVLFRSVAEAMGSKAVLALVMTGMGADGMRGVEVLKQRNCYCITQSAATCVVYGMPQAVDQKALSDESVDLPDLAPRILTLVRHRAAA